MVNFFFKSEFGITLWFIIAVFCSVFLKLPVWVSLILLLYPLYIFIKYSYIGLKSLFKK